MNHWKQPCRFTKAFSLGVMIGMAGMRGATAVGRMAVVVVACIFWSDLILSWEAVRLLS